MVLPILWSISPSLYRFIRNSGIKKKDKTLRLNENELNIKKLDSMSPRAFEFFVAGLLREWNAKDIEVTPSVGDHGADIVGYYNGDRFIVECKKYSPNHRVGAREVRNMVGAMRSFKAKKAMFVTTSYFTKQCYKEFGNDPDIYFIDRNGLKKILEEYNNKSQPDNILEWEFCDRLT